MSDNANVGKLIEIKGVVIDAVFPDGLPSIYSALRITRADGTSLLPRHPHTKSD